MTATSSSPRRILQVVLLSALASLIAAGPVAADAELVATSPGDGDTVEAPLNEVSAQFSEGLKPDSTIELFGPDGESVASGGLDPDDAARLVLEVPAAAAAGTYRVEWQAVSADGHLVRDDFSFTLLTPAPTESVTPEPSPTADPTATEPTATEPPSAAPTAELTDAPSPSVAPTPAPAAQDGVDVLIPIVAALVALAVLGAVLLRRRGPGRT